MHCSGSAAFVLTAPAFGGSLSKGTLNQPGDLTIDSNLNLEFLTPLDTLAISYNQALASTYVTQDGFRVATLAEFEQLAMDAGVTDLSGTFNTGDNAGVLNLISYLGSTISAPFTLPGAVTVSQGVYGFLNAPGIPAGFVNVSGADYQSAALGEAPQDQSRVAANFNQFAVDAAPPISGTFLVRATPEPASFGAMGLGLAVFAGLCFYRQRRVS